MHLSVIICTRNRASLLNKTLTRMADVAVPDGMPWELLVVDNGSSDDTAGVIARHREHLPIRPLFQPVPGKSHALNHAVHEAKGDYLLFTDDDVLVDAQWLAAYVRAFRRHPDAAIFGGPIIPWFDGEPPAWLARTYHQVEYAFAALDLGPEPRQLGQLAVPFGANMAMRAAEQRLNPYDPALGPRPGSSMGGEETTLARRMFAKGVKGWWVPEARVQHYVPRERQTVAYIRSWYTGWGEVLAHIEPRPAGRLQLWGSPSWLWRMALFAELRFHMRRHTAPPERWIKDLQSASTLWGRVRGGLTRNGHRLVLS